MSYPLSFPKITDTQTQRPSRGKEQSRQLSAAVFSQLLQNGPHSWGPRAPEAQNPVASPAQRDRVDAALTALREKGTLAEISQTWFGADITSAE